MRPSWPPPRMPMVAPGFEQALSLWAAWRRLGLPLRARRRAAWRAPVRQRQHGGRQQRRIDRAGLADGERADRDAARHLHDREQRILALQRVRVHRHAEHRQRRHRCGHAGQVGGAAGAGDDHLEAVACARLRRTRRAVSGCDGPRRSARRSRSSSASSVSAACFIVAQSDWLPMMIATGFEAIALPESANPCGRKRRIIGRDPRWQGERRTGTSMAAGQCARFAARQRSAMGLPQPRTGRLSFHRSPRCWPRSSG